MENFNYSISLCFSCNKKLSIDLIKVQEKFLHNDEIVDRILKYLNFLHNCMISIKILTTNYILMM